MRESFIFYKSFYEALEGMDKESQADCLMALARYALTGEEPIITPTVRLFFTLAKPIVDLNNKKFANGCKGGRPKRNQEVTETKPTNNQDITKEKPNHNQTITKVEPMVFEKERKERKEKENTPLNPQKENKINKINKNILPPSDVPLDDAAQIDLEEWLEEHDTPPETKRFKKPTLVEVQTYMNDNGYAVSPERFIAYYDSVGWKVGKNPMKDWKAAIRGWAIRERAREKTIQAAKCLYPGVGGTYGEGVPL
jgi:hypothetical protein